MASVHLALDENEADALDGVLHKWLRDNSEEEYMLGVGQRPVYYEPNDPAMKLVWRKIISIKERLNG